MGIYDDLTARINASSTLTAEDINEGMATAEYIVNTGITNQELQNKSPSDRASFDDEGWLTPDHIYKPEFYGSPSPRMNAVSGQVHFRESNSAKNNGVIFSAELSGAEYVAVPNASTRIKLRHSATVHILCSYYCYEFGGVNKENDFQVYNGSSSGGYEEKEVARTALYVNNSRYGSTIRRIYTSTVGGRIKTWQGSATFFGHEHAEDGGTSGEVAINGFLQFPMVGRHQHFFTTRVQLSEGVHDIGLRCRPIKHLTDGYDVLFHHAPKIDKHGFTERPELPMRKFIFFEARNFIVDAYYSDFDPE